MPNPTPTYLTESFLSKVGFRCGIHIFASFTSQSELSQIQRVLFLKVFFMQILQMVSREWPVRNTSRYYRYIVYELLV